MVTVGILYIFYYSGPVYECYHLLLSLVVVVVVVVTINSDSSTE